MSQLLRNIMPLWQEMADFSRSRQRRFAATILACNADLTTPDMISLTSVESLNCYPSPDRCVRNAQMPVTPFWQKAGNGCLEIARLAFVGKLSDSSWIITPNKGRKSCLRLLGSSQQPQCLASPLASTMTQSAHWLALASAALQAKLLATTTVLKARLLAALSGRLPTTSKVNTLFYTIKTTETAAAGHPCVRRFCF